MKARMLNLPRMTVALSLILSLLPGAVSSAERPQWTRLDLAPVTSRPLDPSGEVETAAVWSSGLGVPAPSSADRAHASVPDLGDMAADTTEPMLMEHPGASMALSGSQAIPVPDGQSGTTTSEAAGGWSIDCVACKYFWGMRDRSLRLDGAGQPHIAYGGDHLYHSWYDGMKWHTQTVDGARDVGGSACLALDGANRPHISYYDLTNRDLKYARFDGTSWQVETVDSAGSVGGEASLALDSADRPHISYEDATNRDLKLAHYDGSSWQIETVDSAGWVGGATSLALDSADRPHISYEDLGNVDLKYAHYNGTSWQIETVNSDGDVGGDTSLALDGADRPHISYYSWTSRDLKYAYCDGTSWQIETVDTEGDVGLDASLALDSANHPHISYHDWTNHDLKYAYHDGASWQIETVATAGEVGWYTSLALDNTGHPHISYWAATDRSLAYAHYTERSWQIETVDSEEAGGGEDTSLALDSAGLPHISYSDGTRRDLKYAHHDGISWQVETVDSAGSVGWDTSLVIDSGGRAHISYADSTNDDLKYAYRDGAIWQTQAVDSEGNVGWHTSLALDGADRPHISYADHTNADLKYAHYDGTTWQIHTVDYAGAVGNYTSLALDREQLPHISYYDGTNGDLKYAHYDGTSWQIETVDSEGNVGKYTSLALDSANRPHISYDDWSNGDLKHACFDGTSWQIEIVESDGDVGWFTSTALDGEDLPHISYYAWTGHDLKYAHHDGSTWQIETVDSAGWVGEYTCLALENTGLPHISYYDRSASGLGYAKRTVPGVLTFSVSGHVYDSADDPVSGAVVSTGSVFSATSDASGAYTITDLITGTYTLTPDKSGWTFTPDTRTVSVPPDATGQDFTGTATGEPTVSTGMPALSPDDPLHKVILKGRVDPQGRSIQAWFEWGTDPNLPTYQITGAQTVSGGAQTVTATLHLTDSIGELCYYRIATGNPANPDRGTVEPFLPLLGRPNRGDATNKPYWNRFDRLIHTYAHREKIPPTVVKAIVAHESSWVMRSNTRPERTSLYELVGIDWRKIHRGNPNPQVSPALQDYLLPDHPGSPRYNLYWDQSVTIRTDTKNLDMVGGCWLTDFGEYESEPCPTWRRLHPNFEPSWKDDLHYYQLLWGIANPRPATVITATAQYRLASSYGLGHILYWAHFSESSTPPEPESLWAPDFNLQVATNYLGKLRNRCLPTFTETTYYDNISKWESAVRPYNGGGCGGVGYRQQDAWESITTFFGLAQPELLHQENYAGSLEMLAAGILSPTQPITGAVTAAAEAGLQPAGEYEVDRLVADFKGTGQAQLAILVAVVSDPAQGVAYGRLRIFQDTEGTVLEWESPPMEGVLASGVILVSPISGGGAPLVVGNWGTGAHGTLVHLFRWDGQTFRQIQGVGPDGQPLTSFFGDAGVDVGPEGLWTGTRDGLEPLGILHFDNYAWRAEVQRMDWVSTETIDLREFWLYLPLILRNQ